MGLTIKFHDFKAGQAGAGKMTAPGPGRILDHLGPTYRLEQEGYLTFDNSYPTGGYSATPAQLGLSQVYGFIAESPGGYDLSYDRTNKKIKVMNGTAEVANGTDLSSLQSAYFKAFGV